MFSWEVGVTGHFIFNIEIINLINIISILFLIFFFRLFL